jgi:Holliday junction resolvase RusA-like endonuclease
MKTPVTPAQEPKHTFAEAIQFFVPGLPQPGGSKRAFYIAKLGRAIVTDANSKAKDWKRTVSTFVSANFKCDPTRSPLSVEFTFHMPRPKGHFGSGKNSMIIKPTAPAFPTTKPDTTKLIRSTEDALTGIVWVDDSQIVEQIGRKVYSDRVGAMITVKLMKPSATLFQ